MDQTTRSSQDAPGTPATGWSAPSTPDAPRTSHSHRDPWTNDSTDPGPEASDTQQSDAPLADSEVAEPQAPDVPTTEASDTQTFGTTQTGPTVPPAYPPAHDDRTTSGSPSRRATAGLVALALGVGVLGGAGGAAAYSALTDEDEPVVNSLDSAPASDDSGAAFSSVEDVAAQVLPSVVSIEVGQGGGSGVIISSDGQILTNNHVAQAAQNGDLTVTFHDGSTAQAEVVGVDELTDVAIIQAQDVSDLQPAELGSSADLQVGEQVTAIGSPLGLDGTVTTGIVSALDRPVTAGDQFGQGTSTFGAIQTDAPINPGNSGGPLVNMSGQVVGINSAIATAPGSDGSIGLGFAIPIDQASTVADQLIESGSADHARIGVGVSAAEGDTRGAVVEEVEPNSAAANEDIEVGDIITHIDERLITSDEALVAAVRSYQPGDEVTLTLVRDGESITVDVTLGSSAPST